MQPHSSSIDTVGGSALRNASVAVKLNGALATIYALDGTPQANPMTTDSTGSFSFRAANGEYTLEISRVGIVPRTETVLLYDPADDPAPAELAASGGAALVGAIQSGAGAVTRSVQDKLRDVVNLKDFGVDTTGATNSSVALTAAITAAKASGAILRGVGGTIRIDSDVNFRDCAVDLSNTAIVCYGGAKAVLGGDARITTNPRQSILSITRSGGASAVPSCRVQGAKDQTIDLLFCDYVQLYADSSTGNTGPDYSIAYSTFNMNKVDKLELTSNASTPNSLVQWINENTFNLKRVTTLVVSGTYPHNHNIFSGGCYESASIDFQVGNSNQIIDARFEGANTVNFASGTWANRVIVSWEATQRSAYEPASQLATVTDAGEANQVIRAAHMGQHRIPLLEVNAGTCRVHTSLAAGSGDNFDYTGNITSLADVDIGCYGIDTFAVNAFRKVFGGNTRIPVSVGDALEFNADVALFRCRIYMYDVNGAQITNADASAANYLRVDADTAWNVAGFFAAPSNTAHTLAVVRNSTVKFLRFEIQSGTGTNNIPFKSMGLQLITNQADSSKLFSLMRQQPPAVTASPARGVAARAGAIAVDTAGGFYQSKFALDTATTASAASGASVVNLGNTTGILAGDVIGVEQSDGSAFWGTVSSIASPAVTLSGALTGSVNSGARVVVNRWAAFKKVAAHTDSVAADVATLKTDFNALLAKMRTAGLLT